MGGGSQVIGAGLDVTHRQMPLVKKKYGFRSSGLVLGLGCQKGGGFDAEPHAPVACSQMPVQEREAHTPADETRPNKHGGASLAGPGPGAHLTQEEAPNQFQIEGRARGVTASAPRRGC